MRVLGVAAVIIVHTCDMVLFSKEVGTARWWAANFVDSACRWAVPMFIMLSGALLLNPSRDESAGQFYRRRLARLGIATAFWSVFFVLFSVYYTGWSVPTWNVPAGDWRHSIWRDLLKGQPYMHMHFVFRLAGLYLITPLLRVYVRHASWRLRAWMMCAILGIAMANSVATCFLGTEPSGFAILWPFLGFYLAGDVLREVKVTRRILVWSCVGYVVGTVAVALGTGVLVAPLAAAHQAPAAYPAIDMMMYDFLNPARVLASLGAWFILAYIFGRISLNTRTQRFFKWLAPATLGIYLVHPLIRELLWIDGWRIGEWLSNKGWPLGDFFGRYGWQFTSSSYWIALPLAMIAILVGSTALTLLLRLVPGVRKIVG
jgi:surface polysaccharide O-acyltransferase-like enzyme